MTRVLIVTQAEGICQLRLVVLFAVHGSVAHARRLKTYSPVLSDWVWHGGLLLIAYACLFVGGVLLRWHPQSALYVVGATAFILL